MAQASESAPSVDRATRSAGDPVPGSDPVPGAGPGAGPDFDQGADPSGDDGRRPIVLATLNSRHSHASLGLRYLKANAGDLGQRIRIEEFVIGADPDRLVDRLLDALTPDGPRLIGFGVYIWNVTETTTLCRRLRARAPDVVLVAGGPEVSHEIEVQPINALVDFVIQGPGDLAFAQLARGILDGPRPLQRIIAGAQPADLGELTLPYPLYDADDIGRRHLYVEASRGCPFKCAFCLSALDRSAWPFPLQPFMDALADLHARGARTFRFVDRTFNLRIADSVRILEFFLERNAATPDDPCQVHFELIPDRLPEALREPISRFAAGTLQFEIGIQTFRPEVQKAIDRRQDNDLALANLRWLRDHTQAHLHVDLIAGLPGESLDDFGAGYDRLYEVRPHEIQLGLLKRLRGAPIIRHERAGTLQFEAEPPYRVRRSNALSEADIIAYEHLAHFHDRIVNGGRMPDLARAVLERRGRHDAAPNEAHPDISREISPFARLRALSTALLARFGRSHGIGFEALVDAVRDFAVDTEILAPDQATELAINDYHRSGAHGRLACMARGLTRHRPMTADPACVDAGVDAKVDAKDKAGAEVNDRGIRLASGWKRQHRHQTGEPDRVAESIFEAHDRPLARP